MTMDAMLLYHRNKIRNGNDPNAHLGGGTLAVAVVEDFGRLANKLGLPEIGALPAWWEKTPDNGGTIIQTKNKTEIK